MCSAHPQLLSFDIMVAPTQNLEPHRRLLTVDEVMRMYAAGIIADDERVELIEGELIAMTPPNAPHSGTTAHLTYLFIEAVGRRAVVWNQSSVRLSDVTLPQPDLALLRPRKDYYTVRLPLVSDMLLAVEVADSSLSYDRNRKASLYALHRVPEYWVLDVNGRELIRLRKPSPSGYLEVDEPTGTIAPKLMSKCKIDVSKLFPR